MFALRIRIEVKPPANTGDCLTRQLQDAFHRRLFLKYSTSKSFLPAHCRASTAKRSGSLGRIADCRLLIERFKISHVDITDAALLQPWRLPGSSKSCIVSAQAPKPPHNAVGPSRSPGPVDQLDDYTSRAAGGLRQPRVPDRGRSASARRARRPTLRPRSANEGAPTSTLLQPVLVGTRRNMATRRTSLMIDPPDDIMPPLTPEGQKHAAEVTARLRAAERRPRRSQSCRALLDPRRTEAAGRLQQQLPDRPDAHLRRDHAGDDSRGSNHPARQPAASPVRTRFLAGDSRGHFEGDTLVVDTTNYHELSVFNSYNCCRGSGKNLHVVERFRLTGGNAIDYQFTVEDPTTFTRPSRWRYR